MSSFFIFYFFAKFRLKLKKLEKTSQPFRCYLNHILYEKHAGCDRPLSSMGKRSYPSPKVRNSGREELPHRKERWLHGHRRAEMSYSTFKVRRGSCEEIPLLQGKEQRMRFAGGAVKR